jgi:hypothetical protein
MCVSTVALLGLFAPAPAFAANTTCPNADFIFPGERAQYFAAASTSLFFKTKVVAGRSYAVMAWAPFNDAGEGGASVGIDMFSDSNCTTFAAGVNTTDYEPQLFGIPSHSGDHDNIIPTADGTIYINVTNFVAVGTTVHVLVMETTLFSPWWFTGGTNQAFVEVRNNMSQATTATVTLYKNTGVVCGTTQVVLAAHANAAVLVNSVGTCATTPFWGSAQIAFPGTPGGLAANTTTIDVPNGTSFDSPFTPRMVWGTFSR